MCRLCSQKEIEIGRQCDYKHTYIWALADDTLYDRMGSYQNPYRALKYQTFITCSSSTTSLRRLHDRFRLYKVWCTALPRAAWIHLGSYPSPCLSMPFVFIKTVQLHPVLPLLDRLTVILHGAVHWRHLFTVFFGAVVRNLHQESYL